MLSRVSLVAILLILNCLTTECTESPQEERHGTEGDVAADERVLRQRTHGKVMSESSPLLATHGNVSKHKLSEVELQDAQSKTGAEERDRPRNRKRRMDRTMMALLMAYKLKFIALIPTMIGGLILLKGTTLLAGFFFALFAAVLGLKVH
ncbi:uncharacterized protein LOC105192498 [Harpegnathos saltator]|uniref:uncharacterized protein LOC105192498 n=1 Tax=Harpegnathos saltator TaxID=610380 RepID=UPI00058DD392|nr:uncharacterized protein LOC105192498 [Harpegnathos saltator]